MESSGAGAPQPAPAPRPEQESWFDNRLRAVREDLERILEDMPESRLEVQTRVRDILGMTPSAEMLHALTLLADEDTVEEIRCGPGRDIVLMRLLVDLELHRLTEGSRIDPDVLDAASRSLPDLIHRVKTFRRGFDWNPEALGTRDHGRLEKLKSKLMPELKELQAFAVLVPRVARLARAARDGHIGNMPFLSEADADLFRAALPDADAERVPSRICLEATALRWAIQEDLDAWDRIRPSGDEPGDDEEGAPGDGGGFFGAEDLRLAILEYLKLDVNAYQMLIKRMQAHQDAARSSGDDALVEETSVAQRALFTTYLELTATVRNPAGKAATQDDEAAAAARERLLKEIQEVEESGAAPSQQVKEEVLLEALTAMRDGRKNAPEVVVPESAKALKRERLRRNILIATMCVLAVVAVAVNVYFMMQDRAPEAIKVTPSQFAAALPVSQVIPVGPLMVSEIPAWSWEELSAEERRIKVNALGKLAQDKGFQSLFVVDEDKRELAAWSVNGGARIIGSGGAPKVPAE